MKKNKQKKTIGKRIAKIFAVFLLFCAVLVLLVRSPWGQRMLIDRAVAFVEDKTGTHLTIDKFFLTFSGDLEIQGLYMQDLKKDTLLYSKNLQLNLGLASLLFDNTLHIEDLAWQGVTANIQREADTSDYNFTFLLDAFSPSETTNQANVSNPLTLRVGSIDLLDFKVSYTDTVLGIRSQNQIGQLSAEVETIDLDGLLFYVENLEISKSKLSYVQTKAPPAVENDTDKQVPQLKFSQIRVKDVRIDYALVPDHINTQASIGEMSLSIPMLNVATNSYAIDDFKLVNSKIALELQAIPSETSEKESTGSATSLVWSDYHIDLTNITLNNNEFNYRLAQNAVGQPTAIPEELHFSNIALKAQSLSYRPEQLAAAIDRLTFSEESTGITLKKFELKGEITEEFLDIPNIQVATTNSHINGILRLDYSNIAQLINAPSQVTIAAQIPSFTLDLSDVLKFQPSLADNQISSNISKNPVAGQFFANGTLDALLLSDSKVTWGTDAVLAAEGRLYNTTNIDALSVDLKEIKANFSGSAISQLLPLTDTALTFPENNNLTGTISGNLGNLKANIQLKSSMGTVRFVGRGGFADIPFVNGQVRVDTFELGTFLNNPTFGKLSLTADTNLRGFTLTELNGDINAEVSKFDFREYEFNNLTANGTVQDGNGNLDLSYKDENLNLHSGTTFNLDSDAYDIRSKTNIQGADLQALGLTTNYIRVGADLNLTFKGNPEAYTLNAVLSEGVSVLGNKQFQVGDIVLDGSVAPGKTSAGIKSDFLSGSLNSNGKPDKITQALRQQFDSYFDTKKEPRTESDSIALQINAELTPKPILTEVFLKGLERLDTITVHVDFNSKLQKLLAELHIPFAQYEGAIIDSLHFSLNGSGTEFNFASGLASLAYPPFNIKKTNLSGRLQNRELLLDFVSYDENKKLAQLASQMQMKGDSVYLHIDPDSLVVNRNKWSVPQSNQFVFAPDYLHFQDMRFSNGNQEVILTDAVTGISKNHVGLLFKNFRLQSFLSFLNPDEKLATGTIKGNLVLEDPFGATGLIADLVVDDLGVMNNRLGNLTVAATSTGLSNYEVDLGMREGGVLLDLTGNYKAKKDGAVLDLFLDLKKLETSVLTGFFNEQLADGKGYLSGTFELLGTLSDPVYEGNLTFHETGLEIVPLNARFKVRDETIAIDETSLILNDFVIEDSSGDTFTASGTVGTTSLSNPTFDLSFIAEEFRLLDSSKKDNELYYGTASIDADISLQGNLDLPRVEGTLRVRKVTELTYVVPEEQLDIEERDGVVVFVNRENPDAILTRKEERSAPDLLQGFDVNLWVEVADDAILTIVLDERTGDVLQVAGNGALNLNLDPNGNIGLTGRYELKEGYYRTSLHNLVSRKFDIETGSTIRWQGDPFDAKLDVTASYQLETSAAPLMAAETSGVETSLASKYQQVMPFLVYLNVDGEITAPEISFALDIPDDTKGDLGGAIYGKVQQLNEQETELNKQVFSLLALNRFFPNTVSDGSSGGAAGLARNNVNKLLSSELNSFSDDLLGNSGFELDFDLDSFTDYTGDNAQDRTQLNINARKKLFNDRLIVTAGSALDVEGSAQAGQEETPIIGNVSLEYLLTKNGRYRLKGFRKNQYINVIDGQVIVTGLALIFNREFNAFSELFNPLNTATDSGSEKKNDTKKNKKQTDDW